MKPHRTRLALLIAAVSLNSLSWGQLTEALAWRDFNRRQEAGDMANSQLLDFSYSGYHFSERGLPNTNRWNRVNVTDFGARPNDNRFDDDGIQDAINAARRAGEPTVVFFPAGRYLVSDRNSSGSSIRVSSSNIVLKGAGSGTGGTVIHAQESGGNRQTRAPWRFVIQPAGVGINTITNVTRAIERGAFAVRVVDGSSLRAGQVVILRQQSTRNLASSLPGLPLDDVWNITDNGLLLQEQHLIRRVDGNTVFFENPVNIRFPEDRANTVIQSVNTIKEVGVEDIRFTSGWADFNELFDHGSDELHDAGWNALFMAGVHNGWVRNCEFESWSNALQIRRSLAVSVNNVTYSGKKGHASYYANESYGVLFQFNRDNVVADRENPDGGQLHGPGMHRGATSTVFLSCRMNEGQSVDCHGNQPYGNLFDGVTGGTFRGNGGSLGVHPHSGPDLTFWNFRHDATERSTNYDFWGTGRRPFNRLGYAFPKFIGFRAPNERVSFDGAGFNQNLNQTSYPRSIFRAQLQMRLQGSYVSASSDVSGRRADRANDDNPDTFWQANNTGAGEWLAVDLGTQKRIISLLVDENGNRIDRYRLERWTGSSWVEFHRGRQIGNDRRIRFRPTDVRRLRLFVESLRSGSQNQAVAVSTIEAELEPELDSFFLASSFDQESNPGNDRIIRVDRDGNIGRITDGSWIRFENFNFADGAARLTVGAASTRAGGRIEARIFGRTGPLIGTINVGNTGNVTNFQNFRTDLTNSARSIRDLYLVFRGGQGALFDIRSFSLGSSAINGYRFCCDEGESQVFDSPVDVAFGARGKYVFRRNVTGSFRYNRASFSFDPLPGVRKRGFFRPAR